MVKLIMQVALMKINKMYPTSGLNVTGLAKVYCILMKKCEI
jgi:hypothetical protein